MATTIATLTQKTDGSLEGIFATIKVNAPIALIPNANKTHTHTSPRVGAQDALATTSWFPPPPPLTPPPNHTRDVAPDYRIIHRRTGFEIGAGWYRSSQRTGEEYLSVKLEAPEIGVIFGNVAPAPGGDDSRKVILWNDPDA
jgi:uncharacterized protein (DUF736 family)